MTEIINYIDDYMDTTYGSTYDLKSWGFCELSKKTSKNSEQPIPVTCPSPNNKNTDRQQVSLDDTFDIITWSRIDTPIQYESSDEWSFGRKDSLFAKQTLRFVVAHKVELGENFIYQLINDFPAEFEIPGFQLIFVSDKIGLDADHETIYKTELGQTVYERHRFPWNLYVINIPLEFLMCADSSSSYRFLEDGTFRLLE